MFELTKEECNFLIDKLRFQNGTIEITHFRYAPMALTEQGVAMLSGVLNSQLAININIGIMRAFVQVRKYLSTTNTQTTELIELKEKIKALESGMDETIGAVNDLSEDMRKEMDDIYLALSQLADKQKLLTQQGERKRIGFKK